MRIVIDTYAWVEFFLGSKKGEKVKEILQKNEEIYTPDIVIAELARKYFREGIAERTILKRLEIMEGVSDIIPINKNIAIELAKCFFELQEKAKIKKLREPSLFDAIILAITERLMPN